MTKSWTLAGVAALLIPSLVGLPACLQEVRKQENSQQISIDRDEVSSSAMRSVGYDADRQILEIEFPNGDVYQYYGIPPDVFDGLIQAESHGRFFHECIRGQNYRYERVLRYP